MAEARGDDAVEVGVEGGDACGDVDVELVEIDVVAAPGRVLPLAVKTTPVMSSTGPVGRWLPGIHLGVVRVSGAGLDGDVDLRVVELAGGFGEVGGDPDGGLLGLEEGGCGEE